MVVRLIIVTFRRPLQDYLVEVFYSSEIDERGCILYNQLLMRMKIITRRGVMELKQLEFFVTTAEVGSLNQAAEILYTSQSNVSKVINALEKELGFNLFDRHSKGVLITERGLELLEYAKVILKNAELMKNISKHVSKSKFSVSSYPSHMISSIFVDFYNDKDKVEEVVYEFYEGTVEEISDNVENRVSEIGILYFSKHQLNCFKHIMMHKNLEFYPLEEKEMCIYVGKNNPLYQRESVHFSELDVLSFVQPIKDYFSLEHHLDTISIGSFAMDRFKNKVHTNSDNLLIDLLMNTDMCSFGIHYLDPNFQAYDIKPLKLEGCSKCLIIGYVKREGSKLSNEAECFLGKLKASLNRSG